MNIDTTQVIALIIFCATMVTIMSERIHRMTAALAGAVLMVLTGVLDIESGVEYIDADTICILVGMMLLVGIVKRSGMFEYIAVKAAKVSKGRPWIIMVAFMCITAILSAVLDNVTTVLLVGPMTFAITRAMKVNPVPFIMTQIMASNIGGTATLIGDPPNIMIGSSAHLSFMSFVLNVGPPVIIVLVVSMGIFYLIYGRKMPKHSEEMQTIMQMDEKSQIKDRTLLIKSVFMLCLMVLAFIFQDYLGLSSAVIALGSSVIMLLIGKQPIDETVEQVEWTSIIFFVGLFVVVGGVQESGLIGNLADFIVEETSGNMALTLVIILWASALLSAFLDNIPFVATMIPLISAMGSMGVEVTPLWWALSLGACLGGNGTLIGASANVVLSGISEREGYRISFGRYMKIGFPVMIMSIIVSTIYLFVRYV